MKTAHQRYLPAIVLAKATILAALALIFGGILALALGIALGALGIVAIIANRGASTWLGAMVIICASMAFVPVVTMRLDARIAAGLVLVGIGVVGVLVWRHLARREEPNMGS